jgi:hypothetical protein
MSSMWGIVVKKLAGTMLDDRVSNFFRKTMRPRAGGAESVLNVVYIYSVTARRCGRPPWTVLPKVFGQTERKVTRC